MLKVNFKRTLFFIIIISCMLVGSYGYSATKKIPPQESLPQNQNFPKNESGETYGSLLGLTPYEKEPDLIKAIGVDNTVGYVRASDLIGEAPKTPEEALAQQANESNGKEIPLYDKDGKTIKGKFKLSGNNSGKK